MHEGKPFGSVVIVAETRTTKYRVGNTTVTTTYEIHREHVGQFPGALLKALAGERETR